MLSGADILFALRVDLADDPDFPPGFVARYLAAHGPRLEALIDRALRARQVAPQPPPPPPGGA